MKAILASLQRDLRIAGGLGELDEQHDFRRIGQLARQRQQELRHRAVKPVARATPIARTASRDEEALNVGLGRQRRRW